MFVGGIRKEEIFVVGVGVGLLFDEELLFIEINIEIVE